MTKVVFRKFKNDGDVIALFPETFPDEKPYVMSYMHLGQHGQADPRLVDVTVLATEEEYTPLLQELKNLCGYEDLQVRKKMDLTRIIKAAKL